MVQNETRAKPNVDRRELAKKLRNGLHPHRPARHSDTNSPREQDIGKSSMCPLSLSRVPSTRISESILQLSHCAAEARNPHGLSLRAKSIGPSRCDTSIFKRASKRHQIKTWPEFEAGLARQNLTVGILAYLAFLAYLAYPPCTFSQFACCALLSFRQLGLLYCLAHRLLPSRQAVKPSSRQAVKPSSRQAVKPSSRQAVKPSSRQAVKLMPSLSACQRPCSNVGLIGSHLETLAQLWLPSSVPLCQVGARNTRHARAQVWEDIRAPEFNRANRRAELENAEKERSEINANCALWVPDCRPNAVASADQCDSCSKEIFLRRKPEKR